MQYNARAAFRLHECIANVCTNVWRRMGQSGADCERNVWTTANSSLNYFWHLLLTLAPHNWFHSKTFATFAQAEHTPAERNQPPHCTFLLSYLCVPCLYALLFFSLLFFVFRVVKWPPSWPVISQDFFTFTNLPLPQNVLERREVATTEGKK